MSQILANMIFVIHLLIMLFVILVPFFGNQDLLFLNFAMMLGILVHWMGSDSTCCLTILEQKLRGESDPTKTFFGKVMMPVYTFGNDTLVTQIGLFVLLMVNLYKLDASTPRRIFESCLKRSS